MTVSITDEVIPSILAVDLVAAVRTVDCKAPFSYPVVDSFLKVLYGSSRAHGTVRIKHTVLGWVGNSFIVVVIAMAAVGARRASASTSTTFCFRETAPF